MEDLLIACNKPVLYKMNSSLALELFSYNISSYYMMLYHIIWCPSIPLCVYNFCLLSFQFYVASFNILSKTESMSRKYYFRCDHEWSCFRNLAVNKCICQKNINCFLDQLIHKKLCRRRQCNRIPVLKVKRPFFKNTFFPSTKIKCNKLDWNIQNSESIEALIKNIFSFSA